MGEHECGVGGKRAEQLGGGAIVEFVEAAAQGLAIERDATPSGRGAGGLQQGGVAAKDRLDGGRIEPLENIPDGGVRESPAPFEGEGGIQLAAMDIDEGDDAAIGVAAGHDGKDGEQQHVGQLVELALSSAWIRDICQHVQQRGKRNHDNLRLGCRPRSQTIDGLGIPLSISRFAFPLRCCRSDSVQPIRQH